MPRLPKKEQPNSDTWERISVHAKGKVITATANGLKQCCHISKSEAFFLADMAVESLSTSPYVCSTHTCSMQNLGKEAIIIGTMMGYITDPEYIQLVHTQCLQNQSHS